ncbi:MAG: hypothetical protein L7H00_06050 [Vulcanisaeta sp.]|nr:hypothetical protein [Vulcanisaeta sp.]
MSSPTKTQTRKIPREPSYEEIFGIQPTGSPVPGGVSIQGGSNPPGVSSAQLRRRLRAQAQPQPQPQQQQQEQAKAGEKPAEQQVVQEQQAGVQHPTAGVFPRGDFKSTQIGYVAFRELVFGLPAYAPTGGVKLIIQKSKYFPTPGKTEDAWSAIVFTYSEMPYGNTMVIVPEPHVITCRNLATCIREGLLALYRYSRKEVLEGIARTGISPLKLYKDTLLIPVCTDKTCMKAQFLVLDPDWPGGFIHIRSSGVDVQLRAVPANEYELFIQTGEKPIFHKYTLALTPNGTYIVTWEKMDKT